MSTIVSCRSISKAFGAQRLFSGLNLVVHDGDRIGLIGPNGSGKSTLLRILCGLEDVDEGVIDRRSNLIVSYLAKMFDENVILGEVADDQIRAPVDYPLIHIFQTTEDPQ